MAGYLEESIAKLSIFGMIVIEPKKGNGWWLNISKKHTTLGKIISWLGFLLSIIGLMFNEGIGILAEDIPETFYPFSLPLIIIGIILLLVSNFFKKKNV